MARKILDTNGNVFWHAWAFDWRGRMAPICQLLSPQGSDIDRAMIRFKEWKPIGKSGFRWMKIQLHNLFEGRVGKGVNWKGGRHAEKGRSFDERARWVDENTSELIEISKNWKDEEYRSLLELDKRPRSKSETFQRLSALFEFRRIHEEINNGNEIEDITSGFPVVLDASCNGYQHVSLMFGLEDLAKKVNVEKAEDGLPQDLYQEVAERAKDLFNEGETNARRYLRELGAGDGIENLVLEKVFNRKMAKLPTMTVMYGALDLQKCFSSREGRGNNGFVKDSTNSKGYVSCWHKESGLYRSLEELVVEGGFFHEKYGEQMSFAKKLAEDFRAAINDVTQEGYSKLKGEMDGVIDSALVGGGLEWSLPDGMDIIYHYREMASSKIDEERTIRIQWNSLVDDYFWPRDKETGKQRYNQVDIIELAIKNGVVVDNEVILKAITDDQDEGSKKKSKMMMYHQIAELMADKMSWGELSNICKDSKISNKIPEGVILQKRNKKNRYYYHDYTGMGKRGERFRPGTDKEGKTEIYLKKYHLSKTILKDSDRVVYWDFLKEKRANPPKSIDRIKQYITSKLLDDLGNKELVENLKIASTISFVSRYYPISKNSNLDGSKMKLSISANLIHSIDACHMRETVRDLASEIDNVSIWPVHDAFGTHACDMDALQICARKKMVTIHQNRTISQWGWRISEAAEGERTLGYEHAKAKLAEWVNEDKGAEEKFRKKIDNGELEVSEYLIS